MGPPSLNGGNTRESPGFLATAAVLQWGRRLSTAEIANIATATAGLCSLQWGRRLSTAEMIERADNPGKVYLLQWGRRLSTAEICRAGASRAVGLDASMGPPSLNGGNLTPSPSSHS